MHTYIHDCMHTCIHAHMHPYFTYTEKYIHTDMYTYTEMHTDLYAYIYCIMMETPAYMHICGVSPLYDLISTSIEVNKRCRVLTSLGGIAGFKVTALK